MRDIIALSTWRLHHWLIAAGVVVYLSIHAGIFPDLSAVFSWLADRPEVADAFREPHFGRADALILLFSTLFLGPLALLIATVLFLFTLAVLGGFVLPVVRVLNLPDWAATVTEGTQPTVYAHVATEQGREDRLALQYWFYYPFNDYNNKH